jgi:hypothetical protein
MHAKDGFFLGYSGQNFTGFSSPEWKKTLFWIEIIGVHRFREARTYFLWLWLVLDG